MLPYGTAKKELPGLRQAWQRWHPINEIIATAVKTHRKSEEVGLAS
ncbi:hypothetical protein ACLBR5_03780 [Escherichia coli]